MKTRSPKSIASDRSACSKTPERTLISIALPMLAKASAASAPASRAALSSFSVNSGKEVDRPDMTPRKISFYTGSEPTQTRQASIADAAGFCVALAAECSEIG